MTRCSFKIVKQQTEGVLTELKSTSLVFRADCVRPIKKHRQAGIYREAVNEQSPTLPLSGYVGLATGKDDATPTGLHLFR